MWDRRTLSENNPVPVGVMAGHVDGITFIDSKVGLFFLFKYVFVPCWKFESFYLGKATAATRAALPIPISVCRIFVYQTVVWLL